MVETRGKAALFALLAASLLAAGTVALAGAASPRVVKKGSQYRLERGEWTYGFDAARRTEVLWQRDGAGKWAPVASPDPARMEYLRGLFLRQRDCACLTEVPSEDAETLKSLKTLGYL